MVSPFVMLFIRTAYAARMFFTICGMGFIGWSILLLQRYKLGTLIEPAVKASPLIR